MVFLNGITHTSAAKKEKHSFRKRSPIIHREVSIERVCSLSGAIFDPDDSIQVNVVMKVAATPVLEMQRRAVSNNSSSDQFLNPLHLPDNRESNG